MSGFVGYLFRFLFALSAAVSSAAAQEDARASEQNCPSRFEVVDLGQWVIDAKGNPALDYGGLLYRVSPEGRLGGQPRADTYLCIGTENLAGRLQTLDGLPVPLVDGVLDADLGRQFTDGYPGNPERGITSGWIDQFPTPEKALEAVEDRNKKDFELWRSSSSPSRHVFVSGETWACLHDAANPTLDGHGDYTCLLTIERMPRPDTFVRCGRWLGGCSAHFSLDTGISIWIQGPFLPHWDVASRARSIPEAMAFWSDLVRVSARDFDAALVHRREDIKLEVE